jgi:hypothetical protein
MAAAPAKNPLSGSGALQGKVGQFTDHPRNPVVGRTGRIGFVFGSLNAGMTLSCHLPIVKKKTEAVCTRLVSLTFRCLVG